MQSSGEHTKTEWRKNAPGGGLGRKCWANAYRGVNAKLGHVRLGRGHCWCHGFTAA